MLGWTNSKCMIEIALILSSIKNEKSLLTISETYELLKIIRLDCYNNFN